MTEHRKSTTAEAVVKRFLVPVRGEVQGFSGSVVQRFRGQRSAVSFERPACSGAAVGEGRLTVEGEGV